MRMIRGNVERIAVTEARVARLESEGYKKLEEKTKTSKAVRTEGTVQSSVTVEISGMTIKQLRAMAKENGLAGYEALSKDELLEILKDVM